MTIRSLTTIFALAVAISAHALDTSSKPDAKALKPTAEQSLNEAKKTLGTVPTMLKLVPEAAVPGAWAEMRDFQMGKTKLSNKTKELIGLAVAAQIPCRYCVYFHERSARDLNGANEAEAKEAIAVAALSRQWSTVLNGLKQDEASFERDLDRMYKRPVRQTRTDMTNGTVSGATSAPMEPLVVSPADEVYREAKKMWGFVPPFIAKFPKQAIVGAWNEYNAVWMSPSSRLSEKDKTLISLAVSSQIPCTYCVSMDKRQAQHAGISDEEANEAIAMSSLTRHWSTVLNGNLVDERAFRAETDSMIDFVKKARTGATSTQSRTTEPTSDTTSGTSQPPDDLSDHY